LKKKLKKEKKKSFKENGRLIRKNPNKKSKKPKIKSVDPFAPSSRKPKTRKDVNLPPKGNDDFAGPGKSFRKFMEDLYSQVEGPKPDMKKGRMLSRKLQKGEKLSEDEEKEYEQFNKEYDLSTFANTHKIKKIVEHNNREDEEYDLEESEEEEDVFANNPVLEEEEERELEKRTEAKVIQSDPLDALSFSINDIQYEKPKKKKKKQKTLSKDPNGNKKNKTTNKQSQTSIQSESKTAKNPTQKNTNQEKKSTSHSTLDKTSTPRKTTTTTHNKNTSQEKEQKSSLAKQGKGTTPTQTAAPPNTRDDKGKDFDLLDLVEYGEVALRPPTLDVLPKARLKGSFDYTALAKEKNREQAVEEYRAFKRKQQYQLAKGGAKKHKKRGFYL